MLSVVTYGRNDSSGYNAHRRVALSLNCIAEVLDHDGDEIVFVDYNTPDGLPTLPETLADTLTDRCRSRLRVLRVRADVHEALFAARTPLPIVEPVARNVAARRANPSNRWLLMTNTDMLFLPLVERSLSHVCGPLADGFYVVPRFELPEWVWEQLVRHDPVRTLDELEDLGSSLRLNQVTTSHDWLRFDCAGDFQLLLREDFVAIDGFDEEMVLGWHVDANLGKRMLLHRGSIESLGDEVAGYHCNHLRTASTYQRSTVSNDLYRFVVTCDRVGIPAQRDSWGLLGTDVEEIDLTEQSLRSFTQSVVAAIGSSEEPPRTTDARHEKWSLDYDSGHVLSHVADAIRVARPSSVAYVGANPILRHMLRDLLEALDGWPPLTDRIGDAEVVVVDLGVDSSLTHDPLESEHSARAAELRRELFDVFETLRAHVAAEREHGSAGQPTRQIVLVNSAAIYWNAYCIAHLECGPTTPHSRVRRATVRAVARAEDEGAARARQLRRWITRLDSDVGPLTLKPGAPVTVDSFDDYAGFGSGWSFPDRAGVTTQGSRVMLAVSTSNTDEAQLVLTFDRGADQIGTGLDARAETATGPFALSSELSYEGGLLRWAIDLPPAARIDDVVRLELELGEDAPVLHLVTIELRAPRRRQLGQARRASHSRSGRTTPRH